MNIHTLSQPFIVYTSSTVSLTTHMLTPLGNPYSHSEMGTPTQHRSQEMIPDVESYDDKMSEDELLTFYIDKSAKEAAVLKLMKVDDMTQPTRINVNNKIENEVTIFLSTVALEKSSKHKAKKPPPLPPEPPPTSSILGNWVYAKVVEVSDRIMVWANNIVSSDESPSTIDKPKGDVTKKRKKMKPTSHHLNSLIHLQRPTKYHEIARFQNIVDNHPTAFLKDGSAYSMIGQCSAHTASDLQSQSGRHVRGASTHRTFTQHSHSHQTEVDQSQAQFIASLKKTSNSLDISDTSANLMTWYSDDKDNDLQPELGSSYQNKRGEWLKISSQVSDSKIYRWQMNINGVWERHEKKGFKNRLLPTINPPPGFCVHENGTWKCSPPTTHRFTGTTPFSTLPPSNKVNANSSLIKSYEAIADTGANGHVFHKSIDLFNKSNTNKIVHTAGGETKSINVSGDFEVEAIDSNGDKIEPLKFQNINQLPECPINLISVSMLCREGLAFHFLPEHAYFTYKGTNYPLEERNGLYVIDLSTILTPNDLDNYTKTMPTDKAHEFKTSTEAHGCTFDLWHKRFGHADKRRIKFLYDNGSVQGLDVNGKFKHDKTCKCETCISTNNAKIHIGEIRKHDDDITRRGQLIYSDLMGPFPASVGDGYKYAISYTDVYSRYSMVYLLKRKSDAPLTIKALHDYYESHNIKISMIRTDQGGEYLGGHITKLTSGPSVTNDDNKEVYGEKFKAACDSFQIIHELCPAYRPEIHGIAERWNRTVMKMANAMMHEARIATPLWSSAISHANLLRNRLPVQGLGSLTPYEIFHGRRPRVDQLRVWGSFCWKLIPVRNKIPGQMIRKRLIYVGESPHRIGFKCFNPNTSKFTTEFELIFDEEGLHKRPQLLDNYDHHKNLTDSEIIKQAGYETDEYNLGIARHIFYNPNKATPTSSTVLSELGGDRRSYRTRNSDIKTAEEENSEEVVGRAEEEDSEEVIEEAEEKTTTWPRSSTPIQKHPTPFQIPTSNPTSSTSESKRVTFQPTQQEEFSSEADTLGPLTNHNLKIALEESNFNFDTTEPKLPRRSTARGTEEFKGEEELIKWIKIAEKHNYPISILQTNPKKKQSRVRYEEYKKATTLKQIYDILSKGKNRKEVKSIKAKTLKDIKWDIQRGYITFPNHEYNYPKDLAEQETIANYCLRESNDEEEQHQLHHDNNASNSFQELINNLWKQDETSIEQNDGSYENNIMALTCMQELLNGNIPEPKSFKKANDPSHPEYEQWKEAMQREVDTLLQKGTWNLVPRKNSVKPPVKCKFVYKKKFNKDSSLQYKARLVGCGYSQVAGEDYSMDEVYAGVCSYSSMRFLMSLACQKNYILYQTDITGAYLESDLKETIYMEVPPTYWVNGKPPKDENGNELICEVKKGLYGLVQSGHAWSECFKEFLLKDKHYNMNFTELTGEPNMFRKTYKINGKEEEIIIGQYVDDCLIAASSQQVLDEFMIKLKARFPVNAKSSGEISVDDPGLLLSMQVKYDKQGGILQFNQERAIETLAHRIEVTEDYPRRLPIRSPCELPKLDSPEISQTDYLSIVGSCLHICQVSRPDCAYAIGVLSRHSATPGHVHMEAAKDLVRYLYSTKNLCIQYTRSSENNKMELYEGSSSVSKKIEERLIASTPIFNSNEIYQMCDSDYAGDKVTRKSTSGWISYMNGGCISWASRLQKLCAQSSAEAEIYAVVDSVKEAIHLKTLCEDCEIRKPNLPMNIWEDNNACIHMGHGLRGNKSAKHYEVRLRFLTENVKSKTIEFSRISTHEQIADGLTKPLSRTLFEKFRSKVLIESNL